ncbi:MAG: glycoside hydrolase family 99-like domain-containing protein [Oscillospiraceae bacterium]|jgi:hypothetical protein|nr:glycoside hydrolase family 99-like domain-containing protein [Oscillospiraceae bacterium]
MRTYDIAAYIWPSYHPDPRARQFWPAGFGEWETVMKHPPLYDGKTPRHPLWGYINESDPRVMEMQIDAAADHGVNVFIYDWYWYDRRPFLERCLNDGFLGARNNERMSFYLMWANHNANLLWDHRLAHQSPENVWLGSVPRGEFEIIGRRLIDKYFSHPRYYRIDGKPAFMIYDLETLMTGLGGLENTRAALDWLRREVLQAGLGGLHLQYALREHPRYILKLESGEVIGSQKEVVETLGFDSLTHYQYCHFARMNQSYNDVMTAVHAQWNRVSQDFTIPYYAHVSIGWDPNPRFQSMALDYVTGNTPAAFESALRAAKEYTDARADKQRRLITVNSWNEWTETSYLQPDTLFQYQYLEAVKRAFPPST